MVQATASENRDRRREHLSSLWSQPPECWLGIRRGENGKWFAVLRDKPDGQDTAVTEPEFEREYEAWEAAFELYRQHVIV